MQKLWFCSGFEFLEMGSFLEKVVLSFFSSKHNNDIMYNYKAPPPPYFMPYITRYYSYSNFPMTPMYTLHAWPVFWISRNKFVTQIWGGRAPPPLQINARSKNKPRTSFPISHNGHPPLEKKYQDPRIFSGVGVGGVVFLLFSFVSYVKYFKLVEINLIWTKWWIVGLTPTQLAVYCLFLLNGG